MQLDTWWLVAMNPFSSTFRYINRLIKRHISNFLGIYPQKYNIPLNIVLPEFYPHPTHPYPNPTPPHLALDTLFLFFSDLDSSGLSANSYWILRVSNYVIISRYPEPDMADTHYLLKGVAGTTEMESTCMLTVILDQGLLCGSIYNYRGPERVYVYMLLHYRPSLVTSEHAIPIMTHCHGADLTEMIHVYLYSNPPTGNEYSIRTYRLTNKFSSWILTTSLSLNCKPNPAWERLVWMLIILPTLFKFQFSW